MPVEIDLLSIERGTITAPAGCGKTHLIGDALSRHQGTKPILVLTHTNAGVAALRMKLDRDLVPAARYRLSTIDGWAIRLVSTFPGRAGLDPSILLLKDRGRDYPAIRTAALRLLTGGYINDILAATYDRLVVDEYQDCSVPQHGMIMAASAALRTVVLGDPMQAIFGFGDNALPSWEDRVCVNFPLSGQLAIPQRWVNVGEEAFGRWLLEVRELLRRGGTLDLGAAVRNVTWVKLNGDRTDHSLRLGAGRTAAGEDEKVLILADTRPAAQRQFASQIHGAVTVENVDLTDLAQFADRFDLQTPGALKHLIEFAGEVMTNVGPAEMLTRIDSLRSGRARREASEAEASAIQFADNPTYPAAASVLAAIVRQSAVRAHRPAILRGAYNALRICAASSEITLPDAVMKVREQSRLVGRPLAQRTVGSTLLLKGLEADVCVILNPELMDRRHLYVAMTRGSKRLIICSKDQVLRPS